MHPTWLQEWQILAPKILQMTPVIMQVLNITLGLAKAHKSVDTYMDADEVVN
jgi:hypothetical protein